MDNADKVRSELALSKMLSDDIDAYLLIEPVTPSSLLVLIRSLLKIVEIQQEQINRLEQICAQTTDSE